MKRIILTLTLVMAALQAMPLTLEPIKFGDFSQWVTRDITESKVLGGKQKTIYAIGPTAHITGNKAYTNTGGSPWATSNVYAKVSGVVKGSNTVSPCDVNGNRVAKMEAKMEHVKVLGLINMDVMVAGSIFLGRVFEPITSTKSPYSKMEMGIPYAKRPKALVFDYMVDMPESDTRTKSTGFSSKKTLPGRDHAEVYVLLQKRWEDANGKLYAQRVGTGRELLGTSTNGWVNGHRLPILYGDITSNPAYRPYMALIPESKSYCARNSHGEIVPVVEEGWDDADATPTHIIVMFSAGSGEPYTGTPGLTLWVDNVGLEYQQ